MDKKSDQNSNLPDTGREVSRQSSVSDEGKSDGRIRRACCYQVFRPWGRPE